MTLLLKSNEDATKLRAMSSFTFGSLTVKVLPPFAKGLEWERSLVVRIFPHPLLTRWRKCVSRQWQDATAEFPGNFNRLSKDELARTWRGLSDHFKSHMGTGLHNQWAARMAADAGRTMQGRRNPDGTNGASICFMLDNVQLLDVLRQRRKPNGTNGFIIKLAGLACKVVLPGDPVLLPPISGAKRAAGPAGFV